MTCDDWKGFGDSSGAEVNRCGECIESLILKHLETKLRILRFVPYKSRTEPYDHCFSVFVSWQSLFGVTSQVHAAEAHAGGLGQ